jgi:hypothetical protein
MPEWAINCEIGFRLSLLCDAGALKKILRKFSIIVREFSMNDFTKNLILNNPIKASKIAQ